MNNNGIKNVTSILVVDDNPKNIQVLGGLLILEDIKVEFALDGKAAINWLEQQKFDLILLDIMMPGMDGYEVCSVIKSNPDTADIPIIFITAKTDSESIIKGFETGGVDYITKPFIPKELIARVKSQISMKKAKEKIVAYLNEIEEINKNIRDSIKYARNIQNAVLNTSSSRMGTYPEDFILYLPKDIVSGDFYWYCDLKDKFIMAVMDSTGHGVPGAFMSILGTTLLNDIVLHEGLSGPDEIMEHLRGRLIRTLGQTSEMNSIKDSIEGGVIVYDRVRMTLDFCGSFNPLLLIHDGVLTKISADRIPIGFFEFDNSFTVKTVNIERGDIVYLFSDGYIDQFGGPDKRKLMAGRFMELLEEIHKLPMDTQKLKLMSYIADWRGDMEQTDDILVVGLKF